MKWVAWVDIQGEEGSCRGIVYRSRQAFRRRERAGAVVAPVGSISCVESYPWIAARVRGVGPRDQQRTILVNAYGAAENRSFEDVTAHKVIR